MTTFPAVSSCPVPELYVIASTAVFTDLGLLVAYLANDFVHYRHRHFHLLLPSRLTLAA